MRKQDLLAQIKTNQQAINALVRQTDLLTVAGNEQREIIAELKQQMGVYEKAFQMAAGRLAAHNGISLDEVAEYASNLLREAAVSGE